MRDRIFTGCAAWLIAIVLCVQTAAGAHAVSAAPGGTVTKESVLEVLSKYDADAYHIMKTEADSGSNFLIWFLGGPFISGIDAAVHETYHGYTFHQAGGFYGERIYLGGGKSYDVDYSIVYKGSAFTKTEEMAKQIPAQLQTYRYDTYVAPGSTPDSNTKGVFGLLNEFTAYYWGLETMNSLAQFMIDTNAGTDDWGSYVVSIGNNMTAYAEFKYWTLRYMLYIKSANPPLYQVILGNENYCAAYRDADAKFVSEIARSKEIVSNCTEYLRAKGCSVDWSDSGIFLQVGYSGSGLSLENYNTLMAELEKAEYVEMDSLLKHMNAKPAQPPVSPAPSFQVGQSPQKLTVNGEEVDCEKYNIDGSNYFKLRDIAYLLQGSAAQFSVVWDPGSRTVSITSGQGYTPDGSELSVDSTNKYKNAVKSNQVIQVNGERVSDLSVYNIGGNNYFRLRDLGELLGFEVDYIAQTNTAAITF